MRLQGNANGGGLSYREQQARLAFERLTGTVNEQHHPVRLPCCGTMVEVADLSKDTYGHCPNSRCGKAYVVLGNNNNPQVRTEQPNESGHRLSW